MHTLGKSRWVRNLACHSLGKHDGEYKSDTAPIQKHSFNCITIVCTISQNLQTVHPALSLRRCPAACLTILVTHSTFTGAKLQRSSCTKKCSPLQTSLMNTHFHIIRLYAFSSAKRKPLSKFDGRVAILLHHSFVLTSSASQNPEAYYVPKSCRDYRWGYLPLSRDGGVVLAERSGAWWRVFTMLKCQHLQRLSPSFLYCHPASKPPPRPAPALGNDTFAMITSPTFEKLLGVS